MIHDCGLCEGKVLLPPGRIEYTNSGWTHLRLDRWESDVARAKRLAPKIIAQVEEVTGESISNVLEVGCGSGFMGPGFAAAGLRYTGTEIDEAGIELARANGVDVHRVAAEELSTWASGRRFDLVISSNVYEHVDRPAKAFEELGRLDAGLIAIIVPNAGGLIASLKGYGPIRRLASKLTPNRPTAWSIDGTWHNIAYNASTLRFLAAHNGLTIERLETTAINDPIWGYVQPNPSLSYRLAEGVEGLASRRTALLMLAKPSG